MTAIAQQPHAVTTAVAGVRAELAAVAEAALFTMSADEVADALREANEAEAQLVELKTRLLLQADRADCAAETGATSTANWYAAATTTSRAVAHRLMRLAHGLDSHEATRAALAAGSVQPEQAQVIVNGLGDLPDALDPQLKVKAEAHLLELAQSWDAKPLRHLARHILQAVAPEIADAHEAKVLEKEERDAAAATRLTIWEDGRGKLHGRFTLDTLSGAAFKRAVMAYAAPKHRASQGPLGERRPTPERLGRAFAEYVQRYPIKKLPKAGGLNARVIVLMSLDTLMGGLRAAHLDTGEAISPGQARRLACEAGIIPAVLGGNSEVLDLGRERRFFSEPQRIAKIITHRTCEVEGCDQPAWMAHMHHQTRWADGGTTNLDDAVLICPGHHGTAHDTRYQMRRGPNGRITFHRRT